MPAVIGYVATSSFMVTTSVLMLLMYEANFKLVDCSALYSHVAALVPL